MIVWGVGEWSDVSDMFNNPTKRVPHMEKRKKEHFGRIKEDRERFASNEKVKQKRRKPRLTKLIDPDDPTTWPRSLETKREKLMYLFDILANDMPGTYKQKWVDSYYEDNPSQNIYLSRDVVEAIADLNAEWKHGGFRNIPMPMAEAILLRMSNRPGDYTIEELRDPNPETRPFTAGDIIAISLSIARFYFMGTNPVFARLIKKTVDTYGNDIGLRHLAATADKMATYEGMFDLSGYDDI